MRPTTRVLFAALLGLLALARATDEHTDDIYDNEGSEGHEEGEEEEEEEELSRATVGTTVLVLFTFIVLLTILFDLSKEQLLERTTQNMRVVVTTLFGELAVLGFISLVLFMLVQGALITDLSVSLYGEEEEEYLEEMFEAVHMALFLVMVIFLTAVVFLVCFSAYMEKGWRSAESRAASGGMGATPAEQQYQALRARFIQGSEVGDPRLAPTFDFAEYLSQSLGRSLGELVEVPPTTWLGMMGPFVVFWLIMVATSAGAEGDIVGEGPLLAACLVAEFALLAVLLGVGAHLDRVLKQLTPPNVDSAAAGDREMQVMPASGDGVLPPPYKELPPRRGVSQHEQLFVLQGHGPELLHSLCRFTLLMTAMFEAVFFMAFLGPLEDEGAALLPLYVALAVLAAPLALLALVRVLPKLILATSVEQMKSGKTIKAVIRVQKTRKMLRALRLISTVQAQARVERSATAAASEAAPLDYDDPHVQELQLAFRLFDKDGSGSVDTDELAELLRSVGIQVETREELDGMMRQLDADGSGSIDEHEFCVWMHAQVPVTDASAVDPEQLAADIMTVLAEPGQTSVSATSFAATLQRLDKELSDDDIREIVQEADEDASGDIDVEELTAMLRKHIES